MKELINDITLYMRANTERDLSIEEIADKYGYSKFHFSREFRKAIGVSPNEYWAAIKIEQSLLELQRSDSIINAHLKTGYQSTGTFTTAFKNATGFTPGEYKDEIRDLKLWNAAKQYEEKSDRVYTHYSFDRKDPSSFQAHKLYVRCHLPQDFKGLLFLGMFVSPLPNKAPIVGKAFGNIHSEKTFIIDQIPDGEYYALVCAIRSNANPLTYFLSKYWLRDLHRTPYVFPLSEGTEIELFLRESLPTDPAIPLNPVKLLVEAIMAKTQ